MLLEGGSIYSLFVKDNGTPTSKSADNRFTYPTPHYGRMLWLGTTYELVDTTHYMGKFDKVKDAPSFVVLFDFSIPRADVSNNNNIYSM